MTSQRHLFPDSNGTEDRPSPDMLLHALAEFDWKGRSTTISSYQDAGSGLSIPVLTNEYWTSRQRAAHSLHEISYRACFKPQLPGFFIDLLSRPGDIVYDPFAGRGTTLLEAALQDRLPAGCDVNALSRALLWPRLTPPTLAEVATRLHSLDLGGALSLPEELLTFYHPETLAALCVLRQYLLERRQMSAADRVDDWIRMVTLNRLTGHSPGFLSVYTLPPNQAVTVDAQRKINVDRNQSPPRRDVRAIVMRKTSALLADVDDFVRARLEVAAAGGQFHVGTCLDSFWESGSIQLIVTSPPFLDVVNYAADNWLRCWFCGLDARAIKIELHQSLDEWSRFIERAFRQFHRLLKPGGFVAFEVGEVRGGKVRLEEKVVPCGLAAGLHPVCIVINDQAFTKTANIWGVSNNAQGTNTNRIVVFQSPS